MRLFTVDKKTIKKNLLRLMNSEPVVMGRPRPPPRVQDLHMRTWLEQQQLSSLTPYKHDIVEEVRSNAEEHRFKLGSGNEWWRLFKARNTDVVSRTPSLVESQRADSRLDEDQWPDFFAGASKALAELDYNGRYIVNMDETSFHQNSITRAAARKVYSIRGRSHFLNVYFFSIAPSDGQCRTTSQKISRPGLVAFGRISPKFEHLPWLALIVPPTPFHRRRRHFSSMPTSSPISQFRRERAYLHATMFPSPYTLLGWSNASQTQNSMDIDDFKHPTLPKKKTSSTLAWRFSTHLWTILTYWPSGAYGPTTMGFHLKQRRTPHISNTKHQSARQHGL